MNWQQGIFVYGIEADLGGSAQSGNDAGFAGALDTIQGYVGGSVRGRVGVSFDRALFYGTAGIAFQSQRYTSTFGGTATAPISGIVFGVGVAKGVTSLPMTVFCFENSETNRTPVNKAINREATAVA